MSRLADGGRRRAAIALVAVFAGAVLISAFTILRQLDLFDEGVALQAARRVAEGQTPYRDFLWPYGPGTPYVLGALRELFGPSLVEWRVVRVLVDASIAVTVFALLRRETASLAWALAGALLAACAMAEPRSANPYAYALLPALLAFLVASGGTGGTARRGAAAGALVGVAAAFRIDFAVFALAAALVALALRPPPGSERRRALVSCTGAAAAVTAAIYAAFLVELGPRRLYDALVGTSLSDASYWRLPFPLRYRGSLGGPEGWKHALDFYVPLLLVLGLAAAAVVVLVRWRRDRRGTPPVAAGLLVLGAGFLVYLRSRTDPFHTQPLDVVLAALLPLLLAGSRLRRPLALVVAAVLALLTVQAAGNRASALVRPPALAAVRVPGGDGVEAPPDEASALEQTVGLVDRLVPPGDPVYVLPRRSDLAPLSAPLLYVLVDRDNPTPRDHGLLTGAAAQRSIVGALARTRPRALVRWTDPLSSKPEPNARGRASGVHTVDDWVAAHYRLRRRAGRFDVLVPR